MSHTIYRRLLYNIINDISQQKEVYIMLIKEAVEKRIVELCSKRGIAINALANISGVSPSTVYSILNEKSQNPGIVTIKKLCDGLEISLREFFDDDIFDDIEQEIK